MELEAKPSSEIPVEVTSKELLVPSRPLWQPNCREFWAKKSVGGFVCGKATGKRKFFHTFHCRNFWEFMFFVYLSQF
jgi:hypothetical protein